MTEDEIFAIGKFNEKARICLTTDIDHAKSIREVGEVIATLHTMPTGPVMILESGDVIDMPASIEKQKAEMWQQVKEHRLSVLSGGCDTPSGRVDTDETSRGNINDAVTEALNNRADFHELWRMADNSYQELDADKMIAVGEAVRQFRSAVYAASFAFSHLISEATSLEGLDPSKIIWPS